MIVSPKPMPRRQLSDAAAAHLRALIISGELAPGSGIRPDFVGELLGTSTTPAREALQLLRVEGFLELSPGRGFTVAPLVGDDIRDLFTAQSLLAGELAARAATRITAEQLSHLTELHSELIAAAQRGDTTGLETMNHEFHRLINDAGGSRKILWGLSLFTRYVPRQFYGTIDGWPAATADDHEEILHSLAERAPGRARETMAAHIIHAGELLAAHFDARMERSADHSRESD